MNVLYWKNNVQNESVLNWIEYGVPIEFTNTPEPFKCANRKFNQEEANFLDQEISRLLKLKYISAGCSDYISPINVVPKRNSFRLVTDLRFINSYTKTRSFRNENIEDVLEAIKPSDNLVTFDIEDGFFNIRTRPEHSKYLAFKWKNNTYRWNVLPFGWCSSPYFFCKIVRSFVGFLRQRDIRVVSYVDDFLLAAEVSEIVSHRDFAINELKQFGFKLNEKKSELTPSVRKKFIGFVVETDASANEVKISIPRDRIKKVKSNIRRALNKKEISARGLARIAGQLISMTKAIIPTKLLLRNTYRLLGTKSSWQEILPLTPNVQNDLAWWLDALDHWNGKSVSSSLTEWVTLETDASLEGWGSRLTDSQGIVKYAQGFWSLNMRQKHSNLREMTAVFLSLKTFINELSGKSVLILSDNISTVAYINMQGGPSPSLTNIATNIWSLIVTNHIEVKMRHLSGNRNYVADQLSRYSSKYEWMLHPKLFQYLDKIWGPHTCDRFASYLTTQITMYNSFHADPMTGGIDALAQMNWHTENNFVNPPVRLMNKVLDKIASEKATATVIAPEWTAMQWCRKLRLMSIRPPIKLPKAKFFCIPKGLQIPEPLRNQKWKWFAWRISG